MATSGSKQVQVYDGLYLQFTWTRTSFSVEDNNSTIYWEFTFHSNTWFANTSNNNPYVVEVNGNQYEGNVESLYTPLSGGTITLATGTTVIPHNLDGSKSFGYSFAQGLQTHGIKSGSGSGTLDTIPKPATIVSAPDFNDEDNPTITYSNPSGENATSVAAAISFTGAQDDVAYREISKTGTSYTFELTDSERATLRKGITNGNTTTVRFYVKSVIDGITYWSHLTKVLTLINYTPTLSPTVVATDARTIELTGDSTGGTIIKYFSDVSFDTGAIARKEATIDFQTIICGSTRLDDYTSNTGTITDIGSNTFYFTVVDSRGYMAKDAVVFSEDNGKFIPYVKLTNKLKTGTLSANGELTFTISGKYFSGSFGAKSNSLEVEYLVLDENGDPVFNTEGSGWVILGAVTPTVDGNDYTFSHTIEGLDYRSTYTLTVNVIDELTPVQTSTKVIATVPVFDWGKDDFKHNTDVIMDNTKAIYGVMPDGSTIKVFEPCDVTGFTVLGMGGYTKETGITRILGNNIYLNTKNDVYINDFPLADFVHDQGTDNTWFYRKWNSGRVELYGYQNITDVACTGALGGMYRTEVITPPAFPFSVASPKTVATYESEGYGAFIWPTTLATTGRPPNYYLVRPTSSTGITGKVTFFVQGEWKTTG